jgi:hypothetical protein
VPSVGTKRSDLLLEGSDRALTSQLCRAIVIAIVITQLTARLARLNEDAWCDNFRQSGIDDLLDRIGLDVDTFRKFADKLLLFHATPPNYDDMPIAIGSNLPVHQFLGTSY